MSRTTSASAIFDAGIFRPREQMGLADGTPVQLHLDGASLSAPQSFDGESKIAWLDYLRPALDSVGPIALQTFNDG